MRPGVRMERDTSLIDSKFGGYKLSLEKVATVASDLSPGQGPLHRQPANDQYSFLHAKLFGEHNHLVMDPWGQAVYWVGENSWVYCHRQGRVEEVWQVPAGVLEGSCGGGYNARLIFIGETEAVVSDGLGLLVVIDTGVRDSNNYSWRAVFHEEVCGRGRHFVAVAGRVEGDEMEVVVQYVEQRDSVEGVGVPKEGESDFINCLDWISFSVGEKGVGGGLRMERVRRVATQGGINYVGLVTAEEGEEKEARLVLSTEKLVKVVFDSMNPITEEEPQEVEMEARGSSAAVFYWSQLGGEDLEVWLYVGEVLKSLVKVGVSGRELTVSVRGVELVRGVLAADVEQESWTWSLQGGKLSVLLCKDSPGPWPALWGREGGTTGEQVTDMSADTMLPHLTSDTPLVNLPPTDSQLGFNSEELEGCDNCDTEHRLVWLGGGAEDMTSLEGRQHLLVLPSVASSTPQLCIRHDVDGLVWRLSDRKAEHVATLPAFGYVSASKTSRKFLAAPPSCSYSVVCDNTRHVYVYRQPQALAAELGLRNRRSGEKVEKVAKQQVVTLETTGEVVGLVAGDCLVHVLTAASVWTLRVN